MGGPHVATDRHAVAVGEADVEHGDVGLGGWDPGERLGRSAGLADDDQITVRLEQLLQPDSDDLVVVEQEHPDGRSFHHGGRVAPAGRAAGPRGPYDHRQWDFLPCRLRRRVRHPATVSVFLYDFYPVDQPFELAEPRLREAAEDWLGGGS
jgi:hypothetical protein